jgi:prepilin signal peptidase PulO-like enzyme (type II secretory pathway)
MYLIDIVVFGVFGLIIGSFLNVVVIRHNTGRSLQGFSGCMSCGHRLKSKELIPVLSWVFQKGVCVYCGVRITKQYPIVELITSALFVLIGIAYLGFWVTVLSLIFISLLICIVVYDIRHTIIPNFWVYILVAIAFILRSVAEPFLTFSDVFFIAFQGPVVAAPLALLWVLTRGRGIGLGDAKLALAAGWLLGISQGLVAVMLAFIIGAFVSLVVLLPLPYYYRILFYCGILQHTSQEMFTMKSEVPFGPFLGAGILLVWFSMIFGANGTIMAFFGFL